MLVIMGWWCGYGYGYGCGYGCGCGNFRTLFGSRHLRWPATARFGNFGGCLVAAPYRHFRRPFAHCCYCWCRFWYS